MGECFSEVELYGQLFNTDRCVRLRRSRALRGGVPVLLLVQWLQCRHTFPEPDTPQNDVWKMT